MSVVSRYLRIRWCLGAARVSTPAITADGARSKLLEQSPVGLSELPESVQERQFDVRGLLSSSEKISSTLIAYPDGTDQDSSSSPNVADGKNHAQDIRLQCWSQTR